MIRSPIFRSWLLICFAAFYSLSAFAQKVTVTPASVSFGNQVQGTASSVHNVIVKNGQTSAITINSITTSLSDYATTNNCPVSPATLAAAASCTISITFTPGAVGVRSATMTVADSGTSSPQLVTLSGTGTASTLVSIAVTPATASVAAGYTQQFTATGTYSNGTTQNLTSTTTWTSSATTIATIRSGGLATSVAAGTTNITAKSGTISGSATLTVTAAVLTSIAITPKSASVAAGNTEQFTATGTYSNGTTQNLTTTAAWTSSATSIATVSSLGLATSLAQGTSTITATSGTVAGSATLTVTAPVLTSISVTPATSAVAAGYTQQFTATGTYSNGTTQNLTTTASWTSSSTTVATIKLHTGLATSVAQGSSTITATSGKISGSATLTVTAAVLTSIAVTPKAVTLAAGYTEQFTATGTYSNGTTQNLSSTAAWTSSSISVATVNSGGLATTVAPGTATITATSGTTSGSATLTVSAAVLTSIAVTPSTASVAAGYTQQFTATGTYSNGTTQNLTTTASWTSSNTAVATIKLHTGLATSVGQGSATITATSGKIIGSAAFTVTAAALTSISVTPTTATVAAGYTEQFTATGTYSNGTTQNLTSTATWGSSAPSVATINPSGLATSITAGASTITATSGTITGSATLTVSAAVLTSIAVTPATASVAAGYTQQFTATGTYSNGTTQNLTSSSAWSSSSISVATINGAGLATSLAQGTSTITATSGTIHGSATLTVTAAVLTSISVTPTTASVAAGDTQQFVATGTYSNGTTQNLTSISAWTSSVPSVTTISGTGLASALTQGTVTITATSGTISGSATLTVTPAVLTSISVTPSTATIVKGTTQQFTATGTYSDGSTQNLTDSVTWSSSSNNIATIASGGVATGVGVGSATISAASGSITASATLTVGQAALVSLAVTPANPSFSLGTTQALVATGTYSDGSTLVLTSSVTWTTGDATIATVSNQGVATSVALGSTSVTAASGTISGSTTLTITPAVLVSIAVTPAIPTIPLGTTQQFTATGTYTDGSTQNITDTVQWSSDTPAVATISNATPTQGLVTSVGQGSANITATSGSITGLTALTVSSAALVSIAVTPTTPTIALGTTQQFTATGTFTDGSTQNLTSTATWSSDTVATATISTSGPTIGLATSVGQGTATITATSGSINGSTVLTVTAAALVSIAINPPTATISLGTTQQFTATGTFTDGTTQDLTQSGHWSSTVATVATISNTAGTAGLASTLAAGTTTIGITSGAVSATATLVVNPAALVSIAISPQSPTIALGTTQQFTATGTYTDGTTQDQTTVATWSSSDATVAVISNAVGSNGLATSSGQGTATISATSGSVSTSTAITVGQASLVSMAVAPSSISIALGYTEQFTATGTFSDGSTQDLTQSATWISSVPTVASVSPTGYASSTYPGATTISASSGTVSGGAVLTISAAVATSLVVTPSNPSVVAGAQQQFTSTLNYSDGSSVNVTNTVFWTSSNPTAATISSGGLATGVTTGSSNIQASWGTVLPIIGTTILNVESGVAVNPAIAIIGVGGAEQFTATVSVSGNPSVTWSVDGIQGGSITAGTGTISSQGLYTAPPAAGVHTITATAGSSSGTATLTIVSASGAIPSNPYFGIDYNMGTPFTGNAISHGIGRLWDTPAVEWPYAQTSACTTSPCPASFSWTAIDNLLLQMFNNSVSTALVTLSRTPSFASSNPSDLKCNYAKQGSTGGSAPGQCDPPSDLNNDGTGADQYWRDWVAAYASHVNAPGYTGNHARVSYWEIWNEPDSATFWNGTLNQLIRMQEDAYCIIKGGSFTIRATGETCSQVQSAVRSVALTGPIDTTSMVIMPSYHPKTTGTLSDLNLAQAFLYCTGPASGSYCTNGGHATTDAINFHTKPGQNYPTPLESVMDSWTSEINQILQPAELLKPLFDSEGGYSAGGWVAPYTVDLNQAAYIARFYLYSYYKGYANNVWYDYSSAQNGLGSAAADTAYSQVYAGMVGATGLACSVTANGTGDAAQPSLYICTLTEPDGTAAQWMWDSDNTGEPNFWDSGAPNNLECHDGSCPALSQSVPSSMQSYVDITGLKTTVVNSQVPVGIRPILVQAKP